MIQYPEVDFIHVKKCKLFNTATMKYLCLSAAGFVTTLDDGDDTKANFDLHFFHALDRDRKETQLVVPVHSSKRCLIMTPDKELSVLKKNDFKLESAMVANNSFFYYKSLETPDYVVFEGMNGTHNNFYLAVNEKTMKLELQEKKGENFPRNMIFERFVKDSNEL